MCLDILGKIPSESIDLIIFSSPYYGLRNYSNNANAYWGGNECCKHEWSSLIIPRQRGSYGNNSWIRRSRDNNAKWTPHISYQCTKCGAWYAQLGLEPTPNMYVDHMLQVMKKLKRVLRKQVVFI